MDKQIGLGTLVKVDHDADTVFTTVACVRNLTPPKRSKNQADATCIDDTLEKTLSGLEAASDFAFEQFWDPTDSNCTMIDTLLTNNTEVNWQLVFPFGTPITAAFSGRVIDTTPSQVDNNTVIARSVMVRRDSAITYS